MTRLTPEMRRFVEAVRDDAQRRFWLCRTREEAREAHSLVESAATLLDSERRAERTDDHGDAQTGNLLRQFEVHHGLHHGCCFSQFRGWIAGQAAADAGAGEYIGDLPSGNARTVMSSPTPADRDAELAVLLGRFRGAVTEPQLEAAHQAVTAHVRHREDAARGETVAVGKVIGTFKARRWSEATVRVDGPVDLSLGQRVRLVRAPEEAEHE